MGGNEMIKRKLCFKKNEDVRKSCGIPPPENHAKFA